jgi:hypothetical protein
MEIFRQVRSSNYGEKKIRKNRFISDYYLEKRHQMKFAPLFPRDVVDRLLVLTSHTCSWPNCDTEVQDLWKRGQRQRRGALYRPLRTVQQLAAEDESDYREGPRPPPSGSGVQEVIIRNVETKASWDYPQHQIGGLPVLRNINNIIKHFRVWC